MCNTCKTTCNCKPARIPKVGEIWHWVEDELATVDVLAVTPEGVLYRYKTNWGPINGVVCGRSLENFLGIYNPPKPKPRVIYVSKVNYQIFDGDKIQYSYDEKNACDQGKEKFVKFVEEI